MMNIHYLARSTLGERAVYLHIIADGGQSKKRELRINFIGGGGVGGEENHAHFSIISNLVILLGFFFASLSFCSLFFLDFILRSTILSSCVVLSHSFFYYLF
jgi:hypothetical protein